MAEGAGGGAVRAAHHERGTMKALNRGETLTLLKGESAKPMGVEDYKEMMFYGMASDSAMEHFVERTWRAKHPTVNARR